MKLIFPFLNFYMTHSFHSGMSIGLLSLFSSVGVSVGLTFPVGSSIGLPLGLYRNSYNSCY